MGGPGPGWRLSPCIRISDLRGAAGSYLYDDGVTRIIITCSHTDVSDADRARGEMVRLGWEQTSP